MIAITDNPLLENIDDTTAKLISVILILLAGYMLSRIAYRLVAYIWQKKSKPEIEEVRIARTISSIVNIITITIALSLLRVNIGESTYIEIYAFLPIALSYILIAILIILLYRIIYRITEKIVMTSGIKTIAEEYEEENTLKIILLIIRVMIFVATALVILKTTGINIASAVRIIEIIIYPIFILILILVIFALKPFAENISSGIILKSKTFFREGEVIIIGDKPYTIDALDSDAVILKEKDDTRTFIPYSRLYHDRFSYREIIYDLDTLEKIKNNFLAQYPSYCGPASASMILKIFGYDISQEDIGRQAKTIVPLKDENGNSPPGGTKPDDLIRTVEKLTKGEVKGVWITVDKITDLKTELKTWLNDKGLIIIDYKKSFLFPEAKKAHYSVCLSVKGEEILVLDPSSKKGGVYFADIRKVYLGMNTYSELLGTKRGYVVLAPKGTRAYHRIENGLIYSDPDLYKNISKSLIIEIQKLHEQATTIENILPKSIKAMIEDYRKKEKIRRVWKPSNPE